MARRGSNHSTKVPKDWESYYAHLTGMTDAFCRLHLDEEYAELARFAIAALCRKRPSPLRSGRPETWGCAVLYALGQVNFLSDKSSSPYMSMQDLCAGFGIAASTGGNKAKEVRKALGIDSFDHRWMLPSRLEKSGMVWMVECNGLLADIRDLPLEVQEEAARQGIIPYVPAYRAQPGAGEEGREDIIRRYRRYRDFFSPHQIAGADELMDGAVADIALRLGVVRDKAEMAGLDYEDLVLALDLALYGATADGVPRIGRYAESRLAEAEGEERALLAALGQARYSIFKISGRHPRAGLMLRDLIRGDEIWLMDMGLEQSAPMSLTMAMRLVRPEDFWISTGCAIRMEESIWRELERKHGIRRGRDALEVPAGIALDEIICSIVTSAQTDS